MALDESGQKATFFCLDWIANFELIEDPCNSIVKIMRINPWIPACINASYTPGVDFSQYILNAISGLPVTKFNYTPKLSQVFWIRFIMVYKI